MYGNFGFFSPVDICAVPTYLDGLANAYIIVLKYTFLQSRWFKQDVWLKCSKLVFQRDLPTEFGNVSQECTSSRIPVSPGGY